jgi:spore germination cell wall hydrolase CwlJ-like protein
LISTIHRTFTVKLLASFRSALLICAALTASTIAPARAGPAGDTLVAVANATLATPSVPDLLDPDGQPQLAQPDANTPEADNPETPVDDQDADELAQPDVDPSMDLASMVSELRGPEAGSRELECLATGVYFESKSEPLKGQLAVAQVIANRANSGGRFPSTYCGVLFQRGQFSFVHGRKLPYVSHSSRQWQTAVAIAKIVDQGLKDSVVGNALFFHARYVSPGWHLKRVASIGNHIFFR